MITIFFSEMIAIERRKNLTVFLNWEWTGEWNVIMMIIQWLNRVLFVYVQCACPIRYVIQKDIDIMIFIYCTNIDKKHIQKCAMCM